MDTTAAAVMVVNTTVMAKNKKTFLHADYSSSVIKLEGFNRNVILRSHFKSFLTFQVRSTAMNIFRIFGLRDFSTCVSKCGKNI